VGKDDGKKLYRVTIEHTTYALAHNEAEAVLLGIKAVEDEESLAAASSFADEVVPGEAFPEDWRDGIPWGSKDELLLLEIWPKA
jgi:hypothetical protein